MRILLIGGGKSGKSTMAQRLAAALSGDAPRYYWATMTPHDDEDLARIRRHVADRAGMDFITVERSFDLPAALPALDRHGTVLFDSVTACLSEQMFPGPAPDAGAANRVLRELLDISRYLDHFIAVRRYLARRRGLPGLDGSLCSGPGGYLSRAGSGI